METYYLVTFFIFGLFFGSFYNVVAYRLPNKMSLIKPASHCPNCNHKLKAYELIPVISWLIQGGKCRSCHKKIAPFYPIFELFTGLMFAITYKLFGISIDTFIYLIFASAILISILSDILYMIILDNVLIVSEILIIILKLISGGVSIILPTIIDMLVPFVIMYLIKLGGNFLFKKESLGDGDICLMILVGLVLGWELTIFVIVLGSFLALIPAIINLIRTKDHELPFGPFLGLASLITLYFGITVDMLLHFLGF